MDHLELTTWYWRAWLRTSIKIALGSMGSWELSSQLRTKATRPANKYARKATVQGNCCVGKTALDRSCMAAPSVSELPIN